MPEIKTKFLFTLALRLKSPISATRLMAAGALDGSVSAALKDRSSRARCCGPAARWPVEGKRKALLTRRNVR